MDVISVCKFINKEIKKQYKDQVEYSKNIKVSKQAFNKWINGILSKNTGANYSTIEKHLNNLGYELTIKKKEPTGK